MNEDYNDNNELIECLNIEKEETNFCIDCVHFLEEYNICDCILQEDENTYEDAEACEYFENNNG